MKGFLTSWMKMYVLSPQNVEDEEKRHLCPCCDIIIYDKLKLTIVPASTYSQLLLEELWLVEPHWLCEV